MPEIINLMSDTVTLPTDEMRKAMFEAEVGDDVYGHDPTVIKLQEMAAQMTGKEAALFVPSGTMGNLIALLSHCPAGKEVFLEEACHINSNEVGGMARIAGLMPKQIRSKNGIMDPDDVRKAIRHADVHFPEPGLICVENTHNAGGGTVHPLEYLKEYRQIADERGLKLHMDGARVFNAAVYLGVDVKEIVQYTDSVMFCLSKGLSAPIGSMLCGNKAFIAESVRNRKMLGGGMRQVGILAAAGIISLTQSVSLLENDHKNARKLAEGLNAIDGINVNLEAAQTNIVFFEFTGEKDAYYFGNELKDKYGVLCGVRGATTIRMLTNRHITEENIDYVLDCARKIMA